MKNLTTHYSTPKQGILPLFFSDYLDICDPVFTFDELMEEVNLEQYLKNIRYMYLMDHQNNKVIFEKEGVDLNHLYIDGSKFEANASKYSWVWKKATEKSRFRLFEKITLLLEGINRDLVWSGMTIQTNTEYVPEPLREILSRFSNVWKPADWTGTVPSNLRILSEIPGGGCRVWLL